MNISGSTNPFEDPNFDPAKILPPENWREKAREETDKKYEKAFASLESTGGFLSMLMSILTNLMPSLTKKADAEAQTHEALMKKMTDDIKNGKEVSAADMKLLEKLGGAKQDLEHQAQVTEYVQDVQRQYEELAAARRPSPPAAETEVASSGLGLRPTSTPTKAKAPGAPSRMLFE